MGTGNPNEGMFVRPFLECLAMLAAEARAAVVGVVHPGKVLENLLPGAHEWRDVPRTVLELILDRGPPERRVIQADKDSLGARPVPTYYDLAGGKSEPPIWTWGEPVERWRVDEFRTVPDRIDRLKIDQAEKFLRLALAEGKQESWWVIKQGLAEGLADRTLRRAAERLGVEYEREGSGREHRSYWSLPQPT
jgi:hypothetical protein